MSVAPLGAPAPAHFGPLARDGWDDATGDLIMGEVPREELGYWRAYIARIDEIERGAAT